MAIKSFRRNWEAIPAAAPARPQNKEGMKWLDNLATGAVASDLGVGLNLPSVDQGETVQKVYCSLNFWFCVLMPGIGIFFFFYSNSND